MFDDPKKELSRLDAELRAESYEEQLEKLQSQEIPELEDLLEEEDSDWFTDTVHLDQAPRSDVRDYRRAVYADESAKENAAVFVEKKKKSKQKGKQKDKQKGGVGCLPFVILLELIGIAGMLWWWYRWMR